MSSLSVDQILVRAQDALRLAQPDAALTHLQLLAVHPLTPTQQAHVEALRAHAYEHQSQWSKVARRLRPYEDRARLSALPAAVSHLLCLRMASLHIEQGALPRALHLARQALELAKLIADRRAQGEAHQMLGKAYRLLGQPAFARQHYQAALNLQQSVGARVPMAWSYLGLGIVATGSSEYALARQSLQRAFNLVTATDDPLLYGLLCSVQASTLVLEETTPLDERTRWFARAQTAFTQIGHRRFLARTLGNWGDQLLQVGQSEPALELLHESLALGQELQDRRSLANGLESLAEWYARQGQYDTSQNYLAEALAHVEGHDHFVELQVRLALARLHAYQGHLEQARLLLQQIIPQARDTEAKQWQVAAQLYLAEIAIAERDWPVVTALLQDSRPVIEQLRSPGLMGHWRLVEGQLASAQQSWARAHEALAQAATIFAVSQRRWWWARVQFALAEVCWQQEQGAAAQEAIQKALRESEALAAWPLSEECRQWQQQHPFPSPPPDRKLTTEVIPPRTELEGIGRVLTAVPFREVVLHELGTLLQAEWPQADLSLTEVAANGTVRALWRSPNSTDRQANTSVARLRLEPWQGSAINLEIRPALPSTPKVANLLQAAQTALEVCAARERESFTTASEQQAEHLERPLPGVLYQSQAMRALAARIHQIQGSDITVLLLGETGTGKELVAQAIHALSTRRRQPFLPFNCATLSSALVESQLFGHRKGAFTGAMQTESGVIRAAEGGTLFLDEIGDLPLEVQPKLLRFLQNKEIHPLGAAHPVKVNVRLIAATHHSLDALLEQGKFREDLYHRLYVMPLLVPPLRERREEIPLLAQHFLMRASTEQRQPELRLTPEALDALMVYDWPGNVRQLENEILRLVAVLPAGAMIRATDLSERVRAEAKSHSHRFPQATLPAGTAIVSRSLTDRVAELEITAIHEALTQAHNNITQAAPLLGLTRKGLQLKLKRYHIEVPSTAHSPLMNSPGGA